jgi:hypothetical protein
MNNPAGDITISLGIVLLGVLGIIASVILLASFIRWIFRIDEIVALLKDIRNALCPQNLISADIPPLQLCEGCSRNFQKEKLKKIASGQMLCPECISNLKKGG